MSLAGNWWRPCASSTAHAGFTALSAKFSGMRAAIEMLRQREREERK